MQAHLTDAGAPRVTVKWTTPQTKVMRNMRGLAGRGRSQCLPWGRGNGKSWLLRVDTYLDVAEWDGQYLPGSPTPGIRHMFLYPTLRQFEKNHEEHFIRELTGEWAFLGAKIKMSDQTIRFPGGSSIKFYSAEQRNNLASPRADTVKVEECDDIEVETFDALVAPWLSEPWSLRKRWFAGTPRRGRRGLLYRQHKAGLPGRDRIPNHFSLHATYRDSPEVVSLEYVEEQRRLMTRALFEREWECNFDSHEGLVYPMFEFDTHVREPYDEAFWTEFVVGGDHGWEDPGVLLKIGVAWHGRDAVLWVLDEIYEQHKTEAWWVERAKDWIAGDDFHQAHGEARWYFDPSRPDRIKAFRQAGCRARPADNAIEAGVDTVTRFLELREGADGVKAPRLYVHPRCENTIREFTEYRRKRKPKDPDVVTDEILDKDNHAMDALRYPIHTRYGGARGAAHEEDGFAFGD